MISPYLKAILSNPAPLVTMPAGILPSLSPQEDQTAFRIAQWPLLGRIRARSLFQETDMSLREEGLSATPHHRQLFLLGAAVHGESIAVDLDGTLIRFHNAKPSNDQYTLTFRLHPGAEAWLLGLSQRNRLLLYTARDTDSLTGILNARNPMRKVFLPHIPAERPVTPSDVYESPTIFSLANWSDMMRDIVDAVLDGGRALVGWENFVMERLALYHRVPLSHGIQSMMHLKLPEIAKQQGKISFDMIVDDSNGLADLLALSAPFRAPLRAVHLPQVSQAKQIEDVEQRDDAILRAALSLLKLSTEPELSSITIAKAGKVAESVVFGGQLTLPDHMRFRVSAIEDMEARLKEWKGRHG